MAKNELLASKQNLEVQVKQLKENIEFQKQYEPNASKLNELLEELTKKKLIQDENNNV